VIQNNPTGNLTIASAIADNSGATGLTKAGPGTLVLSGTNTYSGVTNVLQGTLRDTGSLGTSTVNVSSGANS
jgi:autotransporter-associated beta strand protein